MFWEYTLRCELQNMNYWRPDWQSGLFKFLTVDTIIVLQKFMKCNTKIEGGENFCMPAQWTADLIGEMHLNRITKRQLASCLGVTPEYVSMVLNGHREPSDAEQNFQNAVDYLVNQQTKNTASTVP